MPLSIYILLQLKKDLILITFLIQQKHVLYESKNVAVPSSKFVYIYESNHGLFMVKTSANFST
jgi:phage antirepressor YoqD-like protein